MKNATGIIIVRVTTSLFLLIFVILVTPSLFGSRNRDFAYAGKTLFTNTRGRPVLRRGGGPGVDFGASVNISSGKMRSFLKTTTASTSLHSSNNTTTRKLLRSLETELIELTISATQALKQATGTTIEKDQTTVTIAGAEITVGKSLACFLFNKRCRPKTTLRCCQDNRVDRNGNRYGTFEGTFNEYTADGTLLKEDFDTHKYMPNIAEWTSITAGELFFEWTWTAGDYYTETFKRIDDDSDHKWTYSYVYPNARRYGTGNFTFVPAPCVGAYEQ